MPPKKVPPKRSGPAANVDPEVALKELTRLLEWTTELRGKRDSSPEFGARMPRYENAARHPCRSPGESDGGLLVARSKGDWAKS
jgi:hypothetical protein